MNLYVLFADLMLILHASFVVFVVGGQAVILAGWFKNWQKTRNLWFRLLHLMAISVVVMESWVGVPCPLTIWEAQLRHLAGQPVYELSFIAEWTSYFLFYTAPAWVFTSIYTLFGSVVLLTLIVYPPRLNSTPSSPLI